MKRYFFALLVILFSYSIATAQSTCGNADFEDGNLFNWSGFTGSCCPIVTPNNGLVVGQHTITSGNGTDPITNNAVTVVAPDGGAYSARLGNSNIGAEAEKMSFSFFVDSNSTLFIYRYAVVFEDPGHDPADQPRFQIQVFSQNNQIIPCGDYSVYAGPVVQGFVAINGGSILYKDWTTVGIDLTPYFGTTVRIEFSTGDCSQTGHFGYAYLDCFYSPMSIKSDFCPGSQTTTLNAPDGFASYLWSTGETTQSINITNPVLGTTYSCTISSVTGCTLTLNTILSPTIVSAIIDNNSLCKNAVSFLDSSTVLSGSAINSWQWNFGDGSPIDTSRNPFHQYNNPGSYIVTLIVGNEGGCADTSSSTIIVEPLPQIGFTYAPACAWDTISFTDTSFSTASGLAGWTWNFGDGSPLDFTSGTSVGHVYPQAGTYPVQLIVTDSLGCSDTLSTLVNTTPGPVAQFTSASICGTTQIQFQDITTATNTSITSIEWNFGDGSPLLSGNQASPIHNYPGYGLYTVTQIVTTATGCIDTFSTNVVVPEILAAGFDYSATRCANNFVGFTDTSFVSNGGFIVDWQWDFGDNTPIQTGSNPLHSFAQAGNYSVNLIVTANNGCVDSARSLVTIIASPDAQISIPPVCPGISASISTQISPATAPIISQTWNFGDNTGDQAGPLQSHIFIQAGSFNVSFVIVDNNGCYDSTLILVTTSPVPLASFFMPGGCTGTPINFSASSSISSGFIASHEWDFGDNSSSVSGDSASHIFLNAGVYFASLIAESDSGCRDTVVNELVIADSPVANFSSDTVCVGGVLEFIDQSTTPNGFIANWTWNAGSVLQQVSGQPVVQGVANQVGILPVELEVVNSAGCTDTVTGTALIYSSPAPAFTATSVCEGLNTVFSNLSQFPSGPSFSWNWDLGDSTQSNQFDLSKTYASWGNYPVTLTIFDSTLNGCAASITQNIQVYAIPVAAPYYIPPYCAPYEVSFLDSSTVADGTIVNWNWDLGNGTTSILQNPSTTYTTPGNYTVSLQVVSSNGCTNSINLPAFVNVLPDLIADFDFFPKDANVFQPEIFFVNSSIGNDLNYWAFGDGFTSNEENPAHSFQLGGDFSVQLVIESSYGCYDTIVKKVPIRQDYSLYVPNAFTPNNDGRNDTFSPKGFNLLSYEMKIFDRWHLEIFTTDALEKGWNGKYNGVDAPEDIYVFRITYTDIFKKKHVELGKFSLIR